MKAEELWKSLGLAAPARRALITENIKTIAELKKYTFSEIEQLHGIGPNALVILKPHLKR